MIGASVGLITLASNHGICIVYQYPGEPVLTWCCMLFGKRLVVGRVPNVYGYRLLRSCHTRPHYPGHIVLRLISLILCRLLCLLFLQRNWVASRSEEQKMCRTAYFASALLCNIFSIWGNIYLSLAPILIPFSPKFYIIAVGYPDFLSLNVAGLTIIIIHNHCRWVGLGRPCSRDGFEMIRVRVSATSVMLG